MVEVEEALEYKRDKDEPEKYPKPLCYEYIALNRLYAIKTRVLGFAVIT